MCEKEGLISIQKPHTDDIFSLKKTVEWRKHALPSIKYFVYESKEGGGCGKVIGEFRVLYSKRCNTLKNYYYGTFLQDGCVSREFLEKYAGEKGVLYGNKIINARRYEEPLELREFYRPLQYDGDGAICGTEQEMKNIEEWDCNTVFGIDQGTECTLKSCPRLREMYRIKRPPQSWCRVVKVTDGGSLANAEI